MNEIYSLAKFKNFVYIHLVLRAEKLTIFVPNMVDFSARVIQIYTKFANFTGYI